MNNFALVALALVVEYFLGYPQALFNVIGHPVLWIGILIAYFDEGLNDPDLQASDQRNHGIFAIVAICIVVGVPALAVAKLLANLTFGWIINIALATTMIAQKSLRDHVSAVARTLPQSIADARKHVGKIVGRDPNELNESDIAKAALESLAENTADGITAPIFWYAIFGLPGIVIYKAINTADSMIGHKSEKYLHFGRAAAKLDDVVNWPASRLTGLLFAAAAWFKSKTRAKAALTAMWRDASKHQSPNAGWPEAAMAGALDLKFGGPREYDGETVELAYMGDGRAQLNASDIEMGIELYDRALLILLAVAVVLAMIL